jgi:hypothetical protein
MVANDFKVWLGRKTKPLRRFADTFEFGKGGSSALASILEDWRHRWEPGAILLGRSRQEGFWKVGWEDDRGFLTVAGNRAGKGRSAIIPNLLTWPGSAQASVVGSATTTPIDPTRSSAAGRPTRSMLCRQMRRNWRRNQTQNPP